MGRVEEVKELYAIVNIGSARIEAIVATHDVKPGDLVIVHAGTIISKLGREEVVENLALLFELQKAHYEFNGYDPEEAEKLALKDFESLLRDVGISVEELKRALTKAFSSTAQYLGE